MSKPETLPPLNALRAFESSGRKLSFRAAADELGVSQGAVAQHVRGLEAHLGVRLFERGHRSLTFTNAGRTYHDQVQQAFRLLHEATSQLKPEPAKVTISVTPTFASRWLIPNLGDFTNRNPDIDLRILATEGLSSFHSDGVDLVVRQGSPPFGASLDVEKLFDQDIIAVCSPAIVAGRTLPLQTEDMTDLVLLHDTHNLWPEFLKQVMNATQVSFARGLRFNQTAHSVEAALAGQGIALASRFLVSRDLAAQRLVQPVSGALAGERDFYLIAQRSKPRSAAIQAVWRWMLDQRQSDG